MQTIKKIYYHNSKVFLLLALLFVLGLTAKGQLNSSRSIDSLVLLNSIDDSRLTATDYYDIVLYYFQKDSLFRTMEFARKGIEAAEEEGNYIVLGNIYIIKGYVNLSFGTYAVAIAFFSKGEQVGIDHNIPKIISSAAHGMGRVYNELREYDKALEYLQRGLEISLKDSTLSKNDYFAFYNAIGIALQNKGDFEGARLNFNRYYDISEAKHDTISMVYALVNLGETYRLDSDFKKALAYYQRASGLNSFINNSQAEAAIYGNLANIYAAQGKLELSKSYLRKSINLCNNNEGLSNYLIEDYKSIVDEFAQSKQYDSAYVYYKKYIQFRDSLTELDKVREINNIRTAYRIKENEVLQQKLNQKLKNRTIILSFVIAVSILIVLLLILVYSRYKLRNRLLKDQARKLNLTIDEKNRELVTKVMTQNRHKVIYDELNNALARLEHSRDIKAIKRELEGLQKKISQDSKVGVNWDSFKLHFEQVHPDFFEKLLKVNSSLTQNDLRLCGYIKLNLSTKEIAMILNVSDRAIQTTRYRIKKKLNLPTAQSLIQFIQNL